MSDIVQPFPTFVGTMASADFSPFVVTTSKEAGETSPGKSDNLHLIYPPHLLHVLLCSIGLCFVRQARPACTALYVISVRQAEVLPPSSFRFHLAVDTLDIG